MAELSIFHWKCKRAVSEVLGSSLTIKFNTCCFDSRSDLEKKPANFSSVLSPHDQEDAKDILHQQTFNEQKRPKLNSGSHKGGVVLRKERHMFGGFFRKKSSLLQTKKYVK